MVVSGQWSVVNGQWSMNGALLKSFIRTASARSGINHTQRPLVVERRVAEIVHPEALGQVAGISH
jgi:hypothetical protein